MLRWAAEEKPRILEEARQTDSSVAEVCRRCGISPGQFYSWEKRARAAALEGLGRTGGRRHSALAEMEAELAELRRAVAELLTENLRPKKGAGHRAVWPAFRQGERTDPGGGGAPG